MTVNTPQEMLKKIQNLEKTTKELKKKSVFVGLPKEEASSAIYKNQTIFTIGAIHEFGTKRTPQRSFLRTPFAIEKDKINNFIDTQYKKSLKGFDSNQLLGLIGTYCTNISKKAFSNNGYGKWQSLKTSTIKAKGSSKPLIDTGTLRNSITWAVRND